MRLLPAALPPAAVLLCLTAACGDAVAPFPRAGPPRTLVYETVGFTLFTRVEIVGDTVVLSTRNETSGAVVPSSRRTPSPAEWRAFWDAVRDAGVRRWPAECRANGIETAGFRFELAWADERRAGEYTNAAATAGGRCSTTDYSATQRFVSAVLNVAGVVSALRDREAGRAP